MSTTYWKRNDREASITSGRNKCSDGRRGGCDQFWHESLADEAPAAPEATASSAVIPTLAGVRIRPWPRTYTDQYSYSSRALRAARSGSHRRAYRCRRLRFNTELFLRSGRSRRSIDRNERRARSKRIRPALSSADGLRHREQYAAQDRGGTRADYPASDAYRGQAASRRDLSSRRRDCPVLCEREPHGRRLFPGRGRRRRANCARPGGGEVTRDRRGHQSDREQAPDRDETRPGRTRRRRGARARYHMARQRCHCGGGLRPDVVAVPLRISRGRARYDPTDSRRDLPLTTRR